MMFRIESRPAAELGLSHPGVGLYVRNTPTNISRPGPEEYSRLVVDTADATKNFHAAPEKGKHDVAAKRRPDPACIDRVGTIRKVL